MSIVQYFSNQSINLKIGYFPIFLGYLFSRISFTPKNFITRAFLSLIIFFLQDSIILVFQVIWQQDTIGVRWPVVQDLRRAHFSIITHLHHIFHRMCSHWIGPIARRAYQCQIVCSPLSSFRTELSLTNFQFFNRIFTSFATKSEYIEQQSAQYDQPKSIANEYLANKFITFVASADRRK